jgi:hypothetical protein
MGQEPISVGVHSEVGDRLTCVHTHIDRQTDRQTERQTDRQAGRQAGRERGRREGWMVVVVEKSDGKWAS